jgi:P27 family predicted phage terminase small subunit
MRGRKPVPISVHRARNTFRRGRHASRAVEPVAPGCLGEPPEHLTPSQQEHWRHVVANAPANILRPVDCGALTAYVIALDQHRQAAVMQAKIDQGAALPLLSKAKDGTPIPSPYLRVMHKAADVMLRCASELGFTPIARTRLAGSSATGTVPDADSLGRDFDCCKAAGTRSRHPRPSFWAAVWAGVSSPNEARQAGRSKGRGSMQEWPADKVERWQLDRLVPYARNARTHSDAQVAQIAASVREWGWTVPVLVDESGMLIAGHGRVLAARKLGLSEIPVMVARGWSEAQKRAYVIADTSSR